MIDLLDSSGKSRSGFTSSLNSGYTGLSKDDTTYTGIAFPDSKYYQTYSGPNAATGCNGGICYGDALAETAGWNSDHADYVNSFNPWFRRGGSCVDGSLAGVFYFSVAGGVA